MPRSIFVNLPVKNLDRSKQFFIDLGFSFNEQFTDDTAAALVISDNIFAMLLTEEKFKTFTHKEIINTASSIEVINALSAESREEVDTFFDKAIKAGGKESRPAEDHGFMYGKSFEDLDGHCWEIFWMDPDYIQN